MSEPEITDPSYITARTELIKEQTRGQMLDNDLAESLASTARIAAERDTLRNSWDMAGPSHYRKYYLSGEINQQSVALAIDTLSRWDRLDVGNGLDERDFTIVICSPGGDVVQGFQLYSYLKGLAARRTITIAAVGICASMATVIHQAATPGHRVIEPGCSYLLHEVSGSIGGRLDAIADTAAWMKQLNDSIHHIFAEASGKMSAEEIAKEIERREKFLTPSEVLDWGLADEVRYAS